MASRSRSRSNSTATVHRLEAGLESVEHVAHEVSLAADTIERGARVGRKIVHEWQQQGQDRGAVNERETMIEKRRTRYTYTKDEMAPIEGMDSHIERAASRAGLDTFRASVSTWRSS